MLRLRQYKEADAEIIEQWVQDKDTFMKWGGEGCFPGVRYMRTAGASDRRRDG